MGKALFELNGRSCGGKGGREGSMTGRGGGWLAKRSIVSTRVVAVTGRIPVGLLAKVVATQWESNEEPNGSRWEERIVGKQEKEVSRPSSMLDTPNDPDPSLLPIIRSHLVSVGSKCDHTDCQRGNPCVRVLVPLFQRF
ncbi:hypothetical protein Tco_0117852 [Tanacetum coccineum]